MRVLLGLLVVGALVGCSGSEAPETLRDACYDLSSVFCDRAIQCGFIAGSDGLTCENELMQDCCIDDGTCNRGVRSDISGEEWDSCLSGIEMEACDDVEAGNLPGECLSL